MIFRKVFQAKAATQMMAVGIAAAATVGGYAYYKSATKSKEAAYQKAPAAKSIVYEVANDYCAHAPNDPRCGSTSEKMKEVAIAMKEVAVPDNGNSRYAAAKHPAEAMAEEKQKVPESKSQTDCKIEPFVKELLDETDKADSDLSQISAMLAANSKGKIDFQICYNQMNGLIQTYQSMAKEPKQNCVNNYDQANDKKIKYQNTLAAFKNRLSSIPQCNDIYAAMPGNVHPVQVSAKKAVPNSKKKAFDCEADPTSCDAEVQAVK